ncbi:IQ-domain 19 [Abeliophyllum distichum]|uniref:IQ-domain 19 n=1 Tax=Abeliophyllum distichum TaxID=126358 RepID=A0ABD1PAU4_9LAMI
MGKAGKWIKNFLMGKREEKDKKSADALVSAQSLGTPMETLPSTPKVKRRWSFKRSSSTKPITHKNNRSFDSIMIPRLGLLAYENEEIHAERFLMARNESRNIGIAIQANVAATRIQAVFRAYLAKRALRALRGLVKIQALVRGHLVRKQMAAVLRSIGAVMAIQVRARIQRVQMADEKQVILETRITSRGSALDNQRRNGFQDTGENVHETRGALKSRSGRVNHALAGRVEHGFSTCNRGRSSTSQRERQLKTCPSPSTLSLTDESSITYDGQLEEFPLVMARQSSRQYSTWSKTEHKKTPFNDPLQRLSDFMPTDSQFVPKYMSNTKSSEAKARSHSEPKQRPKWGKKPKSSRRGSSMDGKNDKENLYPWLIKLYGSDKFRNERDCDSISTMTSNSNHKQSLITFEVSVLSFLFIFMSFITLEASDFFHLTAASYEFVLILHDKEWTSSHA